MAFIDPYKNRGITLQDYARIAERDEAAEAESEASDAGVLRRSVDTVKGVYEHAGLGAWRSIEGVFDMVAGVIGGVGGLVSKDFQEGVQDVIEFDVTDYLHSEIFNRAHRMLTGRDYSEASYLDDDHIIHQVAQGVGGMLPSVAVTIATAGAGAPAAVSQTLSTATMAAGAAGQATQEAYLDGAGYYQGLAYGGIRGGTEVVTEKMFGGLDAGLFGKGFLPDVAKSVADTGVKRFVKGALQEGAEEMASEFFDPAARSVYQGKEAYKKYLDPSFYGDVGKAGVVGTLTGAAFSGTVGRALSGGSVAEDVQSVMTEVDTLERKRRNLFANDRLTDEANTRIGEDIRENYRVLEGVLKKAPDNKRAAVMEKYELSRWFDGDGTLKPEFSAQLDKRAAARQTVTDVGNDDPAGSAGLTGRFDSRYHNPNAEDERLDAALSKKGRTAFAGELSKEGKARYRSLKKVMNTFSRVSGDRLHFVIAEESPDTNAYYDPNTDVIVIGADVLEQGDNSARGITQAWFEATLHEVTHSTEGTEAYETLNKQLEKLAFMPQVYEQLAIRGYFDGVNDEISTRLNALLSKESLTEAEQTEVGKLSRKVRTAIEERIQALTAKDALTAAEQAELSNFISESTAIMAERVLNSEGFVRRLIREDAGLVEKLLLKIADIKESLTRVGDKMEREVAKEIKAAEDQLLRAVSEEGYRFDGEKFVGAEDEEDKDKELRDSRKYANKFKEQLEDWMQGKMPPNGYFELGQTPSVLVKNGAPDYPLIMQEEKVYKFTTDYGHEIAVEDAAQIPLELVDPVFLFKGSVEKSMVAVTDILDKSGDPVIVAIHLDKMQKRMHVNRIASVYGKKNIENYVQTNIESGNLLDVSKEKAPDWFTNRGLQLPKLVQTISDADNSIPENSENVNPSGEKSSVKESRKAKSQAIGDLDKPKTPTWEKEPATRKYLGVDATERVAIVDDRAYGTTDISRGIDNVIVALQTEIEEGENVSENKQLVVKLSEWKKSSTVNEFINKLREAQTPQERDLALDAAVDATITNAYVKTILADDSFNKAIEKVNILKQYRRKVDLSRATVSQQIKQAWGKKNGLSLDGVVDDLQGVVVFADPSDISAVIQDIHKAYEDARQYIKINKTHDIRYFTGEWDENFLRERMKDAFKRELDAKTSANAVQRLEKQYNKQLERATDAYNFTHRMHTVYNYSFNLKNWKTGRFLNQSQPENHNILNRTLGQLCRIMNGGSLNKQGRKYFREVYEWYVNDAKKYLRYDEVTKQGEYSQEIAEKLRKIGFSESESYTSEELGDMINIFQYFKYMTEHYQKIWRNGKLVDAAPIAKRDLDVMRNNARLRVGFTESLYSSAYMRMYGDPHMLVKYMDKYKDGFFTRMYREIRDGLIFSEVQLMRMRQKLDVLTKEDKHYFDKLKKATVNLHGATMPKSEAMSLYLTANREQALAGLLENGYSFVDDLPQKQKKGDGQAAQTEHIRRVFGFTGDEKVRDKDGKILPKFRQVVKSMQDEIYAQLSETDKQFMKIASELLQNDCKRLKVDTDMKRMGYTNILEEFYYPIRRANTFKTIEQESFFDEVGCVANQSFNKNIDKNAKNQLFIEPLEVVLNRHMRGVCLYAGLGTVVDTYDTLKHIRVEGTNNKPISIATEMDNAWVYGTKYFEQLMKDVKGIRPDSDELTRLIGKIRGNYAKFALAANPKVIGTQLSSVFAASNLLDYSSLVKGFSERGRDVFDYCELAELRAYENQAAMAQGLIDKAGDKLMKPIGWTDSFVVRRLFVACQHQVAKNRHLTLGTPENKQAAGELLREVILETQQNALATEKSEAARSSNEIQKMITMFTSDAVKLMGRVLDAFGEVSVIKRTARVDGTPVDKAAMKKAQKRLGRALGSLGAVAVYTMLLSMLVKWFLNKDDEEITWMDWLSCFFGTLLGGLPIISDAYDRFFGSGYGLEDMSISAVNDVMDSFASFFNAMGSLATGDLEGREAAKTARSMLYSLGQVSGIPIRNVYNWSRGILDKISSDAVYKMDNAFYKQSYNADIKAAIEAEDEDRLATVVGVMLDENVGEVTSSAVRQEMNRLVINGMDVLPRGVGDTITYEGQSVKLTAKQKAKFREVYGEANEAVSRMVSMKLYAGADDEAKAKAIKRLYGIYYNRAIEDLLGVSIENKNVLMSRAVDPAQLSIIAAVCAGLTADVGADGKAVSGSKKTKVVAYLNSLNLKAAQKHLILGYLGYKNTLGEEKVRAYLAGLGLGKGEAEALLEIGGY